MDYNIAAEELSSKLGLSSPPIALSFVESPPDGVRIFDEEVPSACTFWTKAADSLFYAPAEKHYNCPIGAMTMGFAMPKDVQQNLMTIVGMMTGNSYISEEEPPNIPTVKKEKKGILYGPLKGFPIEPDLVLLWLTPRQAMIYNEAAESALWSAKPHPNILGRPACAALPAALEQSRSQLSMGCAGMRTFTEISDDKLLVALPGKSLTEFLDSLAKTSQANSTMQSFYNGHKASFSGV